MTRKPIKKTGAYELWASWQYFSFENMFMFSCELINWKKILSYMRFHLLMSCIAWDCDKAAWKHELSKCWVHDEQIFIARHM